MSTATAVPTSSTASTSTGKTTTCCLWCGAAVRLVQTSDGVLMPLNPRPHPAGRIVPRHGSDGVTRAWILTGARAATFSGPLWRSHVETCAGAVATTRRGDTTLTLSRYLCPGCLEPLPVVLLSIGQASHPSCRTAAQDVGLVAGHVSTPAPTPASDLPTQSALL